MFLSTERFPHHHCHTQSDSILGQRTHSKELQNTEDNSVFS